MAIIHKTTMSPGKLELLAAWLPAQPWYLPTGRPPALARAGGFRLDDPEGEVGIEFMVVTDSSGEEPTAYHVPLTYRGAPLAGAEAALVGTTEHGVLGRRWVYDGPHDPVLSAQLLALFQGRAEPQAQSLSDTPDPTVTARYGGPDPAVARAGADALTVTRVLGDAAPAAGSLGEVTAGWTGPDGTAHRGVFASLAAR
ncbi:maltokinase N-terminal cap-like domain-containing protein [Streptomyces sp. NRRL S-241]|uniref:maltokinase N-terminal cap-like domain-containing protein n=1 Tax=Streptomyces sp. NRRL S-241 TaxID=1463896 RepID=UPI0004BFA058|nr:hypothetical protein [Streptomyces sp. NRRL S-241]